LRRLAYRVGGGVAVGVDASEAREQPTADEEERAAVRECERGELRRDQARSRELRRRSAQL